MDEITRKWIRGPADEKAAENGCRFDASRADFAVDWIQSYCVLYEGDCAGQLMKLQDWQYEFVMRLFGWVRYSEDHKCEIRRFRRASVFIAKKNKKSPTLAAIGLYLLCGDGEQGQKVFSCARDGKQALISHTHATEMVRRSPELSSECGINRTTGRITHESTRSFYSVISGDNIEGQEGLNGSVLVDETHVVDARLMKRLRYAGISRREPLHIEVSTAGTDPESYGKRQFDHALAVQEGRDEDQELLAMVFAAPQDLTDADLDANLVKYGKMANPAWGHTIREEEFVSSYNVAKKSLADLSDFKMYRLNIWQRSSSPWLRSSDWAQCYEKYSEDDLQGRPCFAGLDLAKTRDFTALGMVFPFPEISEECVKTLVRLWVPEKYARENGHLVPFLEWARAGWIELTQGDVVDFGYIRGRIRKDAKKFRIRELAYDPWHAEETTQAIEQGVTDDVGVIVEEATGIKRVQFPQGIKSYAGPTAQFERIVLSANLRHNGNPVLEWMAGHIEVSRDVNGNMRPIKPDGKADSVKKIDGIVALIMGLGAYMNAPRSVASKYEREGLMSL